MHAVSLGGTWQTLRSRLGRLSGSVLALLIIGTAITPFLPLEAAGAYATFAILIGTVTAGVTILRKISRIPPEERLAWRFVGVSMLMITTGMAIFLYSVSMGYTDVFGPQDLGFLAGYATGMIGLTLLPHTTGTSLQRVRLLLDGIIGSIALIALGWIFLFADVADALADAPAWERIVGSAYPALDMMMLIVVMVVLVRRSTYRFDPRLTLFALGSILLVGNDVAFLLTGVGRSFQEAEPIFSLPIAAVATFVALGAILDRPIEPREYADRPSTPVWAMVIPYGTAATMVAILIVRAGWSEFTSDDAVLHFATLLIGIMVFIRQGVAIRENRRFIEGQRGTLVASISHELRTPLTAMVGFLDLLDSGAITDPGERDEMIEIVSGQANYLSGIVSDLTMLAAEHVTPMDLDVSASPVDSIAWEAVNTAAVDASNVRVEADRSVTTYVDKRRIVQALANYLSNAERYGGQRITVVAAADGGDLLLEVHDDGPGVPRKYELLIWQKFERGPHRLNAVVPGSGIGLAVTDSIAKAHGGVAGYRRSNRLGGACFWIRLPGRVQVTHEPKSSTIERFVKKGVRSA